MAETVEKDAKESITRNKRARHDYHIIDTWEAGMVLTGSEVKSLRNGKANISDSYAIVKDGEVFLLNLHISPYEQASYYNHEPTRTRKLLLHRKEIRKMIGAVERQGLTLIPLELYFKRGKAKVALALGKGKKLYDKRADEKRRDDERDVAVSVGSDAWNDGQTTVTTILKQPGITGSQAPKPVEFDDRDNSRSPNVTSEETARYRHHACRVFAGLRPRARTTMTLTPSGSAEDPFSTA